MNVYVSRKAETDGKPLLEQLSGVLSISGGGYVCVCVNMYYHVHRRFEEG